MWSCKWPETPWCASIAGCNNWDKAKSIWLVYPHTSDTKVSSGLRCGPRWTERRGPDPMLSDSVAATVSSHFMGAVWSVAAAFSRSIEIVRVRSTHVPVCPFYHPGSGTSGEDQAPSQPLGRLSKPIEGLQHLNAAPEWRRPALTGKGVDCGAESILPHENLCKETAGCGAQWETHRRKGPSPITTSCPGCYGNGICM